LYEKAARKILVKLTPGECSQAATWFTLPQSKFAKHKKLTNFGKIAYLFKNQIKCLQIHFGQH
jgi:hypothetical protein